MDFLGIPGTDIFSDVRLLNDAPGYAAFFLTHISRPARPAPQSQTHPRSRWVLSPAITWATRRVLV
jgi:hypothetical protein